MVKLTKTERIENIVTKLKTRKSKNVIYVIIVALIALAFGHRFYAVSQENSFEVFNIIRHNAQNGVPVHVLEMQKTEGVLLEPLTIKRNRGYISGARLSLFKPGQKMGNCSIISVSQNIDLDTGMYVIRTNGCQDGLQYVENKKSGFYIPVSTLRGNTVYVVNEGVAQARQIVIENRDMENALIKSGINTGDLVILSNVKDGEKIKIEK